MKKIAQIRKKPKALILTTILAILITGTFVRFILNPNPGYKNTYKNQTLHYSFKYPDGWRASASPRFSTQPERGEYGSIFPFDQNTRQDGLQMRFDSAYDTFSSGTPNYPEILPNGHAIKGHGANGWFNFDTDHDPNINNVEVFYAKDKTEVRFSYEVSKKYKNLKDIPYINEFEKIAQTFSFD